MDAKEKHYRGGRRGKRSAKTSGRAGKAVSWLSDIEIDERRDRLEGKKQNGEPEELKEQDGRGGTGPMAQKEENEDPFRFSALAAKLRIDVSRSIRGRPGSLVGHRSRKTRVCVPPLFIETFSW